MSIQQLAIENSVSHGAIGPGASVSTALAPIGTWTVKLKVESLTAGKRALIAVEESLDSWITVLQFGLFAVTGPILSSPTRASADFHWQPYDFPKSILGAAGARMRLNVLALDPGAVVTLSGWIEW